MRIFVDADACPVIDEILAVITDWEVVLVHNQHHELNHGQENVTVKETGDRPDEADHYIYNHLQAGDLVITDDLGLASLVVGKGGEVLRFRGDMVDESNVELRLVQRYAARKERESSQRTNGPPAFTKADREKFKRRLKQISGKKPD